MQLAVFEKFQKFGFEKYFSKIVFKRNVCIQIVPFLVAAYFQEPPL